MATGIIGQAAQTGTPLAWLALLAALRGREDYDDLLEEVAGLLTDYRLGVMDRFVADVLRLARAVAPGTPATQRSRYTTSLRCATGWWARLMATPRIKAAVQAADAVRAQAWTEEMDRFAAASALPWAQAVTCYGRALMARTGEATALFESS